MTKLLLLYLGVTSIALADSALPVPEETRSRIMSDDATVTGEFEYKKRYTSEAEKNAVLQSEMDRARENLVKTYRENPDALLAGKTQTPGSSQTSISKKVSGVRASPKAAVSRISATVSDDFDPVMSFMVTADRTPKTILPMGSYVRVKVMNGVESAQEPLPMLLQLDFAFTGPNHTRVDLKHCFMMAKVRGNISNERAYGETTEISCVRENGEYVKKPAHGYLVGEDSTFGPIGTIVSKKGQAIAAAAGLSAIKGIGEAIGLTESSAQTFSTGSVVEKTAAVTGNKTAFVVGRASMEAATLLAQEAIEQARQFQPAVAVGSGRDIWVVMLDSVEIPSLSNADEMENP